jgi:hypothetical protein
VLDSETDYMPIVVDLGSHLLRTLDDTASIGLHVSGTTLVVLVVSA